MSIKHYMWIAAVFWIPFFLFEGFGNFVIAIVNEFAPIVWFMVSWFAFAMGLRMSKNRDDQADRY